MITCGHCISGPMSQVGNNLDANVTGIQEECTSTTDDIKRLENEEFFGFFSVQ